jgi:hypothetical protein
MTASTQELAIDRRTECAWVRDTCLITTSLLEKARPDAPANRDPRNTPRG